MRALLAVCVLCVCSFGMLYGFGAFNAKESAMSNETAIGHRGDSGAEPFDDDIAAVVEAWGEPIPNHLELVGGPAEWGWAAMRYEIEDGELRFFGEFRNWRYRYIGEFSLFGGKTDLSAETIFTDYRMSSIDTDAVLFSEIKGTAPVDYFRLRAKDLGQIEDKLQESD